MEETSQRISWIKCVVFCPEAILNGLEVTNSWYGFDGTIRAIRNRLIYLNASLIIKSKLLIYSLIQILGSIDLSDGNGVVGRIKLDKLGGAIGVGGV